MVGPVRRAGQLLQAGAVIIPARERRAFAVRERQPERIVDPRQTLEDRHGLPWQWDQELATALAPLRRNDPLVGLKIDFGPWQGADLHLAHAKQSQQLRRRA